MKTCTPTLQAHRLGISRARVGAPLGANGLDRQRIAQTHGVVDGKIGTQPLAAGRDRAEVVQHQPSLHFFALSQTQHHVGSAWLLTFKIRRAGHDA